MTLNRLVQKAASAYPDAQVLRYWDEERECATDNPGGGDGLAMFIARELYETFDPDADDGTQTTTAAGAMRRAADDLLAVMDALDAPDAPAAAAA